MASVGRLMEEAAAARRRSQWQRARALYEAAAARAPGRPEIRHNLALCLHAIGLHETALEHSEAATRASPGVAALGVLRAKIERALGRVEAADATLRGVLDEHPLQHQATLELARLTLAEVCDAGEAQRLAAPLLGHPEHDRDARYIFLMAKLYDREESPEEYTRQVVAYAERHFRLPALPMPRPERRPRRKARVGLLSPLFCASPVYFLAFGALSALREDLELVALNRGTRDDWATSRFRALAAEWHDVAGLGAEALATALYGQGLDALLDLGGWTDPVALKALSARPAPRIYKWVGGQCCTTGMKVFDGFLSDAQHTPPELAHLYTEPLILLEGAYVSYTPPPYAARRDEMRPRVPGGVFGVTGNPLKLSAGFFRELASALQAAPERPALLRFVDRRYRSTALLKRVRAALHPPPCQVEFVAPGSQRDYLEQVSRLDLVIDTSPYSGGLTTLEALHGGARCMTRPGSLFCERHSASHLCFSGLPVKKRDGYLVSEAPGPLAQGSAAAHRALARALLTLLHG